VKAVPGSGAEIVLTVDGELRKTRLFRSHEQAELAGDCEHSSDVRREGLDVNDIPHSTGAVPVGRTRVRLATATRGATTTTIRPPERPSASALTGRQQGAGDDGS
jgi:hypothetical protein